MAKICSKCYPLQNTKYRKTIKRITCHKKTGKRRAVNHYPLRLWILLQPHATRFIRSSMILHREYKYWQKQCITCIFRLMQTTTEIDHYVSAYILLIRYSNAMLIHIWNVVLSDYVKNSRFQCCFWSARWIERQSRTSDDAKIWFFISVNVQW